MAKWDLYCARGITGKDRNFDPKQIEAGLEVGLNPQPIISGYNPELIDSFVNYLKLKKNKGIDIKLTPHARSDLLNEQGAKNELDALVDLNKKYGGQIIQEVVFHAGEVCTEKEEFELRKKYGFEKGASPFDYEEFMKKLRRAEETYRILFQYGEQNGIDVLVENIPVNQFEQIQGKPEDKSAELKKDIRWVNTRYVPDEVQTGLLGSSKDLKYILGIKGHVCIDIEHLSQTEEYFAKNYGVGMNFLDLSIKTHKKIKYVTRNGRKFSSIEFIKSLDSRIKICHLGGQVSMFYQDEGITKIGSHMPITFPGDPNAFIVDESSRKEQNALRKIKIPKDLTALHEAGCRKAVFELHLNEFYGKLWKENMIISKRNVESVLDKLD
ncbi:hypothetical protein JW851_03420 [Candidatus Woesearchaeota archaeon]|nr:hypothetical protein [Candidatus Woesearchaeota archaeon]